MAGISSSNTTNLTRTNVWTRQMKDLLEDELIGQKFVRILSDFPDGYTINIPSIGAAHQQDFTEGQAIRYLSMDTGNFTFSFDQYKYSATSISEKFKRDSFYGQEMISHFVPSQHRVLMQGVETRILAVANSGQTVSNLNTINGSAHRFVGSGTVNSVASITVADFARAQTALYRANVSPQNLVAIIDPSVAYALQTQANIVNGISPNPQWQNIMSNSAYSGFTFRMNVYGFDCYVSNYLPSVGSETIDSVSVTSGVANYLFSASPGDTLPWIGAFRQMPTVYSEFNKDLQQTEYLTITEYGFKLYRPENMVTILSSTAVVA